MLRILILANISSVYRYPLYHLVMSYHLSHVVAAVGNDDFKIKVENCEYYETRKIIKIICKLCEGTRCLHIFYFGPGDNVLFVDEDGVDIRKLFKCEECSFVPRGKLSLKFHEEITHVGV